MECIQCRNPIILRMRDTDEPKWPYKFNEEDENDPEHIKYNEYIEFSDIHFHFNLTYDEIIMIRDGLIPIRPGWMNEEVFIAYENATFLYHTIPIDSDKWWEQYNIIKETKKCLICI